MDRNDWIDLLQRDYDGDFERIEEVLDSHIPAACPDCKGTGDEMYPDPVTGEQWHRVCTHPNAPTVEQVLTVGLRTLSAEEGENYWGSYVAVDGKQFCTTPALLRALRGEDAS